jgi:hypothetical protein
MGAFTLGKELIKFAVSKGIPADFFYSLGKEYGKNPKKVNIAERIKNAYGDSITGSTINKIKKGIEQFYQKKADGGMMEARKKGMGLKMANGGMANLKPIPEGNKGLPNLPQPVRNKMGFMKDGGVVKKRVAKRKPKARGTGAAIKGTKFKGVF